jgi:hypothetical protein
MITLIAGRSKRRAGAVGESRLPTWRSRRGLAALAGLLALAASVTSAQLVSASASGAPQCKTAGLVIWLQDEPGGGTAGSIYYKLELTNLSGHACTLRGYPGVSAVALDGRQLGGGSSHEASRSPRLVTLADGGEASAVLRILDAGAISGCRPAIAAGLRVYPPGQRASKVVPFPFEACSRAGESNLVVGAAVAQE